MGTRRTQKEAAVPSIVLDLDGQSPIYRQIADQIRGLVARRMLEEGRELPSVRRLGAMLGVNLNTVARAYRILSDEGVIELKHGAGARVAAGARPPTSAAVIDRAAVERLRALLAEWRMAGADRASVAAIVGDVLNELYERKRRDDG